MGRTTQAVIDKALSTGLAISMRVGVHTGMVIGGIIGTVRFHFDMWGNGVIGAMRMEELGAKGRVHISNTTAQLLGDKLPLEAAHEMERSFAEKYRIERSFFVDGANIDLAKYAVYTPDVQITTECKTDGRNMVEPSGRPPPPPCTLAGSDGVASNPNPSPPFLLLFPSTPLHAGWLRRGRLQP